MKIKDVEILMVPGHTGTGPDHWQSRWQNRMATARRVEQETTSRPVREKWVTRIRDEIGRAEKPVVLVAHSLGVAASVLAAGNPATDTVAGGFFVAPPNVDDAAIQPKHLALFGPYAREPLPFPSFVIASRDDPYSTFEETEDIAAAWGSFFIDAGNSGHLNAESGHGPWPEGLMVFAEFMKRL